MSPANLLTQWSRLLMASLADAGVRNVVLSPGSRSTPFMLAAVGEPRLVCHDSIDERAAAFFALGQARVTGMPSVLVCTSGTAAAHYLPAVVEASLAGVPLVVLTSDRPLELQDNGAAQTIDQVKLYGDHVRRFFELGAPDPAGLSGVRRMAAQAVHLSRHPEPGAVHLNARARKPLEPRPATTEEERALGAAVDALLSRPAVTPSIPSAVPANEALDGLAALIARTERGLIVAGPGPMDQGLLAGGVAALARRTRYPVLAEATSQMRGIATCAGFDAVLRSKAFRDAHRPDLIVHIGGAPTSSGFEQYAAAHDGVARVALAPHGWPDPDNRLTHLVLGDPGAALDGVLARLGADTVESAWATTFAEADARAWAVVDGHIDDGPSLSEGRAVRTVAEHLPAGSLLMLGNSLAVREIDTFCRPGTADVAVLCQRGANGIDGLIAGAAGSACTQDRPVTLLLGDVSFLHDLTGLALGVHATVPLVVVVLNNGGGRIFEQLPLAGAAGVPDGSMEHVTTPHGARLEHAAHLYGHAYRLAATAAELAAAIDAAHAHVGCTVVEVALPEHGAAEQHRTIFAAVDAAVRDL